MDQRRRRRQEYIACAVVAAGGYLMGSPIGALVSAVVAIYGVAIWRLDLQHERDVRSRNELE